MIHQCIGEIPFMNDALATIGVQGYTQVLFLVEIKLSEPWKSGKRGKKKEREGGQKKGKEVERVDRRSSRIPRR